MAGYAVYNIDDCQRLVRVTMSRLEERINNTEHQLAAFNAHPDIVLLSQLALTKLNRAELKTLNQIKGQVTQLADICVLYDYFMSEMQLIRGKQDRLYGSVRSGNPDLTTIPEIFDTSSFGRFK